MRTNRIALIGVLTALYIALGMLMKIPVIGNIQLDLGYISLAIACGLVGPWAGFVGAVGCGLESLLFSAYGFSISWFIANLIIGIGCGYAFKIVKTKTFKIIFILLFVFFGVGVVKTGIECYLYSIPLLVKIPKNLIASAMDSLSMIIGVLILPKIKAAVIKEEK